MKLETRFVALFSSAESGELRIADGQPNRFVGLIPYGTLSVDLGGWRERITDTAFRTTLNSGADVRALVDHSSDKLLGRTMNQTLRLANTPNGLEVTVDLPDTTYARDTRELVQRRDIRGLSFGFMVRSKDGHRVIKEGGNTIRELLDVDLKEVSIVSNPAYLDTTVAVRSAQFDPSFIESIQGKEKITTPLLSKSRKTLLTTLMKG